VEENQNNQLDEDLWPEVTEDLQVSHLDLLYATVFNSPDGLKVLKHLESTTIDQPCWFPGTEASQGYFREGQNSLVRQINSRIRRAKNV
tara:strand:+ start:5204 stop:5470 length:267 start_codon:yes stop_codon:yes gene_type:complete